MRQSPTSSARRPTVDGWGERDLNFFRRIPMNKTTGRLLALDYGSRRIGLAVSDPLGITAQPLPALMREGDEKDIEAIAAVADEKEASAVVIGLPLLPDGNEGTQAVRVRKFVAKLRERIDLPVETWD